MKREDWHESVQGYVIDCLDWFDLDRYDRQSKKWDVLQWRNAIAKRQILKRLSNTYFPKEGLKEMFLYLNDDTKDDLFICPLVSGSKRDETYYGNRLDGGFFFVHDDLDGAESTSTSFFELARDCGGFYLNLPKIKPCVQNLTCEFAYELYEDMGHNLLFKNEKSYRHGVVQDIENSSEYAGLPTDVENYDLLLEIANSSHQPRLKPDDWTKPYYEIACNSFGCGIAQKLVEVNLAAPKDKIISAFESWLNKAKKDFDCPDPTPRPERKFLKLETKHFQKWKDWRLLAFIDYAYWRKMNGKESLDVKTHYLNVLFPDPDIKTSANSPKIDEVMAEANWLMLPSTISLLDAAIASYPRNHPAVLNPPRP